MARAATNIFSTSRRTTFVLMPSVMQWLTLWRPLSIAVNICMPRYRYKLAASPAISSLLLSGDHHHRLTLELLLLLLLMSSLVVVSVMSMMLMRRWRKKLTYDKNYKKINKNKTAKRSLKMVIMHTRLTFSCLAVVVQCGKAAYELPLRHLKWISYNLVSLVSCVSLLFGFLYSFCHWWMGLTSTHRFTALFLKKLFFI